jgi:hypothetical protein
MFNPNAMVSGGAGTGSSSSGTQQSSGTGIYMYAKYILKEYVLSPYIKHFPEHPFLKGEQTNPWFQMN